MAPKPSASSQYLSPTQQQFIAGFVKATGLDPNVAAAWLRNEEPKALTNTDPQGHGAYNFMNIGITGRGNFGANDPSWKNPTLAGQRTGEWMKGVYSVPGFGKSIGAIQDIFKTAGQSPQDQIHAIQTSGWAGGHPGVVTENAMPGLYNSLVGSGGVQVPTTTAADLTTTYQSARAGVHGRTAAAQTTPVGAPTTQAASPIDNSRAQLLQYVMGQTNQFATGNVPDSATPSLQSILMASTAPQTPQISSVTTPPSVPTGNGPQKTSTSTGTQNTTVPTQTKGGYTVGTFEGTKVASWMVPALEYARSQGWKGTLTSGLRSTALQAQLYAKYQAGGNIAAKPGQSNHEIQNGGAFDATDPQQLNKILQTYKGQRPIWAPTVGLNDSVHFSKNGH